MTKRKEVNIAVAEFEKDGDYHKCFGHAFDERDNAIHMIFDALEAEGIAFASVRRVYSEWRPSLNLEQEIAERVPNAALTWSFEPGDEDAFRAQMEKVYRRKWWQFWRRKP